nr:hypothetical protein [Actinomycetota bacterium]
PQRCRSRRHRQSYGQLGARSPTVTLPIREIEAIIRAKGTFANGVLNIGIDRNDLDDVTRPECRSSHRSRSMGTFASRRCPTVR